MKRLEILFRDSNRNSSTDSGTYLGVSIEITNAFPPGIPEGFRYVIPRVNSRDFYKNMIWKSIAAFLGVSEDTLSFLP